MLLQLFGLMAIEAVFTPTNGSCRQMCLQNDIDGLDKQYLYILSSMFFE